MGVDIPDHVQGRSFAPILNGQTPDDWPMSMYYRYWMHRDGSHNCRAHYGIRTRTHKLICYYNDPLEIENVIDDPSYAAVRAELETELARLQTEVGDTPYPEG